MNAKRARHARGVKWCWGCQAEHPFTAFRPSRSEPDGLTELCIHQTRARSMRRKKIA